MFCHVVHVVYRTTTFSNEVLCCIEVSTLQDTFEVQFYMRFSSKLVSKALLREVNEEKADFCHKPLRGCDSFYG